MRSTVETASDIRPFHVDIPDEALEDLVDASRPRTGPRKRPCGSIPRRAARHDPEVRALLDDGLRLAHVRGEPERPTAVHHRDPRTGLEVIGEAAKGLSAETRARASQLPWRQVARHA